MDVTVEFFNGSVGEFSVATSADKQKIMNYAQAKKILTKTNPAGFNWGGFVGNFGLVILVGVSILAQILMQRKPGGKFGKSKHKLLLPTAGAERIRFKDVAGIEEVKEDLAEIVDYLRDPAPFKKLGARIPRGVLLSGPPGTGKTLLARAIAGEANVPFFTISGSDFVEMFIGVGASRMSDMFEEAKKNSPCIVFIDEIDAIGRVRGTGNGGGNDEREGTLNQLLVQMDGFEPNVSFVLIAATNRPDILDPALLRPGRFDRQIQVPNPDLMGRFAILQVHVRNVPLDPSVDLMIVARKTAGMSGADLMNLVNESALLAARRGLSVVGNAEFESAFDKIKMGAERKSLLMTDEEKKLTSDHESGHAICAVKEREKNPRYVDSIHKATIIPRGRALGMVEQHSEENNDRTSRTFGWMLARLVICMGGRAAEEIVGGSKLAATTGAESDIEAATRLARAMVTEWGYSDEIGMVRVKENPYAGAESFTVAQSTKTRIDKEVKKLIADAMAIAKKHITDNRKTFDILSAKLIEYETLTGAEIDEVIAGRPIREEATVKSALSGPVIAA